MTLLLGSPEASRLDLGHGDTVCNVDLIPLYVCPHCRRVRRLDSSWASASYENERFIEVCTEYITSCLGIFVENAHLLYIRENHSSFCISVLGRSSSDDLSLLVWFNMYSEQCIMCRDFIQSGLEPHWAARVEIFMSNERREPLLWIAQQISSAGGTLGNDTTHTYSDRVVYSFNQKATAFRFVNYVKNLIPVKLSETIELVSDIATPYTCVVYSLQCPSVWLDDLVVLPSGVAAICMKIGRVFHFVDPVRCSIITMDSEQYWDAQFHPLKTVKDAIVCNVLRVDQIGTSYGRLQKADIEVCSVDGKYRKTVRSHLGYSLRADDFCLCYEIDTIQRQTTDSHIQSSFLIKKTVRHSSDLRYRNHIFDKMRKISNVTTPQFTLQQALSLSDWQTTWEPF